MIGVMRVQMVAGCQLVTLLAVVRFFYFATTQSVCHLLPGSFFVTTGPLNIVSVAFLFLQPFLVPAFAIAFVPIPISLFASELRSVSLSLFADFAAC